MKNMSFSYLLCAVFSAAGAVLWFYLAADARESEGLWLFAAFGFLFSVLPALALIRLLASKSGFLKRIDEKISPAPAEPRGATFSPHWVMMGGLIVTALLIISVIINALKACFKNERQL